MFTQEITVSLSSCRDIENLLRDYGIDLFRAGKKEFAVWFTEQQLIADRFEYSNPPFKTDVLFKIFSQENLFLLRDLLQYALPLIAQEIQAREIMKSEGLETRNNG